MTAYLKAEKPPPTFKGRISEPRGEHEKLPDAKYDLPTYMGKHPLAESCPVWSFGAATPPSIKKEGVGPGQYNPHDADKVSAPHYTMRAANRGKYNLGPPGNAPEGPFPDPPVILKSGHRSNSMPNWTMRQRFKEMRKDLAMARNTPGPGHYLSNVKGPGSNVYDNGNYRRPPRVGFGVGSRW
jgi:hypothetical protein